MTNSSNSTAATHQESNDPFSRAVIGCAIEVHRSLGPGLLESAYQFCLAHELATNDIPFAPQVPLPLTYKGQKLDCGYRVDFIIADYLILELKTVSALNKVHHAQILTYMKLTRLPLGILLNFNEATLKDGIRRFAL